MTSTPATPVASTADPVLLEACRALLMPLAQLAVARGLHYGELDELLRCALVEAALSAHPEVLRHRAASRVSTATGLNRREVGRLIQDRPVEAPRRSPATELFTMWLSDPAVRGADGAPLRKLPRAGAMPSFELLAQAVTRDVHPRSLLEDMCRLGLARLDEATDQVELLRDSFVPTGDEPRMLGFLSANVGAHLRASVANVLGSDPRHLEQALFADELSESSIDRLRPVMREQWQQLLRTLAPVLRGFVEQDAAAGQPAGQRVRIGMYSFDEPMEGAKPAVAKKSRRRGTPDQPAEPRRRP
jgi:hypothetical protein